MGDKIRVTYPLPKELRAQLTDIAVLLQMSEKELVAAILYQRIEKIIRENAPLAKALTTMKEIREHNESSTGILASED